MPLTAEPHEGDEVAISRGVLEDLYDRIVEATGAVVVGKRADFSIVDGDPAADIHAITKMPLVFKAAIGIHTKAVSTRMKGVVGLW